MYKKKTFSKIQNVKEIIQIYIYISYELQLVRNDMGVNEHERPNFTLRQK